MLHAFMSAQSKRSALRCVIPLLHARCSNVGRRHCGLMK
jgi:hypothetical protein